MLGFVRVVGVVAAVGLVALAFARRSATKRVLQKFLFEPSSPVNLALLRIFIFALVFRVALRTNAVWYAELPLALRHPPFGWGPLRTSVLFEPDVVAAGRYVLVVASACATLGLFTRLSAPIAAFSLVVVIAICNFFEKINHGFHAPALCALALAFAPCGDAVSLDRLISWWRRRPPPTASAAYGTPVRICWLLLGTTYFFPGFWKLWWTGDLWLNGEALRLILHTRWGGLPGFVPPFRLDKQPVLLALLGTATLVFEIGFIFALFHRVTRVGAAFAAFAFHFGVRQFLKITFPLYLPFILLIDFPGVAELVGRVVPARWRAAASAGLRAVRTFWAGWSRAREPQGPAGAAPPVVVPLLVGALLFSGQLFTGFRSIDSWPLSVFPRFADRQVAEPRSTATRFEHQAHDGKRTDLGTLLRQMGPARIRRVLAKLSTRQGKRAGKALIKLFEQAGLSVQAGDRIAVYRSRWSLFPLGKRANFREELVKSYVVTADRSLSVEKDPPTAPDSPEEDTPRESPSREGLEADLD